MDVELKSKEEELTALELEKTIESLLKNQRKELIKTKQKLKELINEVREEKNLENVRKWILKGLKKQNIDNEKRI